jgi:triosephosphate isomerase
MRKKIVAGNWKMNKTAAEAIALANEVAQLVKTEVSKDVQVIMAPPSLFISEVNKAVSGISNLAVSAQNCHEKSSGAYTGEISANMLATSGISYVILGHSERRQYFAESNAQLALAAGLTPIFCCGESLDLREGGEFLAFVAQQLTESLFHLSAEDFAKVVIAYEPIWAIGTGLTASSDQAQEMHAYLRGHLATKYGQNAADDCSILYGGSCNAKNAKELFACADVDGGLIGGASLVAADFITIASSF